MTDICGGGGVALGFGFLNVGGKAEFTKRTTTKTNCFHVCEKIAIEDFEVHLCTRSLELCEEAQQIWNSQPSRFTELYGDSFVVGYVEGGEFVQVLTIKSQDREQYQKIRTEVRTKVVFWTITKVFEVIRQSFSHEASSEYDCYNSLSPFDHSTIVPQDSMRESELFMETVQTTLPERNPSKVFKLLCVPYRNVLPSIRPTPLVPFRSFEIAEINNLRVDYLFAKQKVELSNWDSRLKQEVLNLINTTLTSLSSNTTNPNDDSFWSVLPAECWLKLFCKERRLQYI